MAEYRNITSEVDCYSTVAKPGDRIFCVTISELINCGVTQNYVFVALQFQRQGKHTCWPHHKEGKTIYLHYDGLKEEYKARIRATLLDNLTPEEWYNKNGRVIEISNRLAPYVVILPSDNRFFDTATYKNGEKLSLSAQQEARQACAWLSLLSSLKTKEDVKKLGYKNVAALYADVIFLIKEKGIQLPAVYCKLREKIREYEKRGPECCIDQRGQSNKNGAKVFTEEQVSLLRGICSRGASYNAQQIADLYNMMAVTKGWDKISRRSALNYLNEYHLIVKAGRDGSEAFRNKISMQVRRKRPTEALSFWTLDGWTVELYYQKPIKGPDGKVTQTYMNRLTVVVVLDTTCDYPVGFAIGESESVNLIHAAVKNAIDHCHETFGGEYYRPYQIQSDHYGIKSMGTIYRDIAEYFTPARVKNAKAKVIERYFLGLNREYCQKIFGNSNFSGFGITSKKQSQPNIDMLNFNKRNFPDKEGCMRQIEWIMAQERNKKRGTWLEAWERMPAEDRLIMDRETYLLRFGSRNDRTKRLEAGCFNPHILGEERFYDSFDLDFRKNPLQSWTVIYDEKDLSTILVTDETEKRRFLLEAIHEQPMSLRDRKPGDFEALRKVDEFNKQVLEKHVVDTGVKDMENITRLLEQSKELEGKQAYTMLTDSRSQHKVWLQHSKAIKSEEDLAAEVEEKQRLTLIKTAKKQDKKAAKLKVKAEEAAYEEYARKVVEIDKFR